MNNTQIKTKLEELPIEELSMCSEFIKRDNYKINGQSFIQSFFQMISKGHHTLEQWASQLYQITGHAIRVQSLQAKLQFRHIKFCELLLGYVLRQQVLGWSPFKQTSQLLENFERVFVEDSSCITLPKMLQAYFPGSTNQKGNSSSARMQLRLELKSGYYTLFELQAYTDNDQKFSGDIVSCLRPGDLVIRDLGYWVLDVLKSIGQKKAFFLSRYKYGTNLYDAQTGKEIKLAEELNKVHRKGGHVWQTEVLLGKKHQIPIRLVAIKCSQQIEQQRKRRRNKDKRANRSKQYWDLLGWTIFITNVEQALWNPMEVLQVYAYRWRIEVIFKCWKSRFRFTEFFKAKNALGPARVYITFYLLLIWLSCFFVRWYNFFLVLIFEQKGKILSIYKFADFFKDHFDDLINEQNAARFIDMLAQYFTQTKRKTKSYTELIYMLNSA